MYPCHFQQSNSLTSESIAVPLKPSSPKPSSVRSKISTPPKIKFGTPPRHSMAPQAPDACKCHFCGHFFCLLLVLKLCIVHVLSKLNCFFTATRSYETELSTVGKDFLQSTFSDGHYFIQDWDISVIKGKFRQTC